MIVTKVFACDAWPLLSSTGFEGVGGGVATGVVLVVEEEDEELLDDDEDDDDELLEELELDPLVVLLPEVAEPDPEVVEDEDWDVWKKAPGCHNQ